MVSGHSPRLPYGFQLRRIEQGARTYWIKPGQSSGHNGRYMEEWVREVEDPAPLKPGSLEFELYAAYFD